VKSPTIRILGPGDEAVVEAFLLPRVETSMFLIGNMRSRGLTDSGQAYEGTYVGAFEAGSIVGVVAHYWNQVLVFQAPARMEALCRAAVRASGRPVGGLIGPSDQVGVVKEMLDVAEPNLQMDDIEKLYSLDLDGLIVPDELESGVVQGRRMEPHDLELLTRWRIDYALEAMGEQDSPRLRERIRASTERYLEEQRTWVLEHRGEPVACSSFNTAIKEAVQVGGVWTPPELRSRGYGRAVVAASLLDARVEGVTTAILFTPEDNIPAQKAYEALGFRHIGSYRIVLFRSPLERVA
jgi:ribosomal protein S18 acetylase RimI-like enzyme